MMHQLKNKAQRGVAVMTVMIIILVLTVSVFMLARNTQFVTKLSGFFKRSEQLQEEAETGIVLARTDLSRLLNNSQMGDPGLESFVKIPDEDEPLEAAFHEGLYFDFDNSLGDRTLTPRYTRNNGDITTNIYYFPEDPCLVSACGNLNEYDRRLPKYFLVVAEAVQQSTGEVYTIESRIQIRMENFAEISLGIHGVGSFPDPDSNFYFYPGMYGRTHINLPADQVIFQFSTGVFRNDSVENLVEDSRNRFWFMDPVTFHNETPSGQDHPFKVRTQTTGWSINADDPSTAYQYEVKPYVEFEEGYKDGVNIDDDAGFTVPTSDAYIDKLKNDYSANTITANCGGAVGGYVDKCYKLNGAEILEYNCNVNSSGMMGRIDDPVLFWVDPNKNQTTNPQNLKPALEDFVNNTSTTTQPSYVLDTLNMSTANNPLDRYQGEWADRLNGTSGNALPDTLDSTGIYVCEGSDDSCGCRVHIKGILDGQLTMVSDRVVIEGDLVYQNQSASASDDILGIIAREQVEIPEGIPQGISVPSQADPITEALSVDKYSPIGDGDSNTITPAEAYLGITNFIPQNSGSYEDRDVGDESYASYANYWDRNADSSLASGFQAYNAVNALDIDAHIYSSGPLVVQGIFNPEANADQGIGVLTCENADCSETKRRNPFEVNDPDVSFFAQTQSFYAVDGDGNYLQDGDGNNIVYTNASDVPSGYSSETAESIYTPITNSAGHVVEPMYYANGVGPGNPNIMYNLPSNQAYTDYADPYYNPDTNGKGEVIPRAGGTLLSVFGSMNTQFFYSQQNYNAKNYGFKAKIFKNDPRSFYLIPPGFPPTNISLTEEVFRKSFMGRSKLLQ
jgi:hypothetical protein